MFKSATIKSTNVIFSVTLLASLAGAMMLATSANAASFNCRAASEPAERTVCANARLSSLDTRMSRVYNNLMQSLDRADQREGLRDQQYRFLQTRDACGRNVNCIKGAYLDQIEVLKMRQHYADNGWLR